MSKINLKTLDLGQVQRRMIHNQELLYISCYSGWDLSHTGDSIGISDLKTRELEIIKSFNGPSVIIPADDKIFMANYDTGIIDALNKKSRNKLASVKVGGWPSDLEYFDNC